MTRHKQIHIREREEQEQQAEPACFQAATKSAKKSPPKKAPTKKTTPKEVSHKKRLAKGNCKKSTFTTSHPALTLTSSTSDEAVSSVCAAPDSRLCEDHTSNSSVDIAGGQVPMQWCDPYLSKLSPVPPMQPSLLLPINTAPFGDLLSSTPSPMMGTPSGHISNHTDFDFDFQTPSSSLTYSSSSSGSSLGSLYDHRYQPLPILPDITPPPQQYIDLHSPMSLDTKLGHWNSCETSAYFPSGDYDRNKGLGLGFQGAMVFSQPRDLA